MFYNMCIIFIQNPQQFVFRKLDYVHTSHEIQNPTPGFFVESKFLMSYDGYCLENQTKLYLYRLVRL